MRKSNYDKFPSTKYNGFIVNGWEKIRETLAGLGSVAADCYTGICEDEVITELSKCYDKVINTRDLMKSEDEIRAMTSSFMTEDSLFGYLTNLRIIDFFNVEKLVETKAEIAKGNRKILVIGAGAAMAVAEDTPIVYLDMARWEIVQRFRRHEVMGLGVDNRQDAVSIQYKRGLFIDWRVLDLHKDKIMDKVAFWIDTNDAKEPKMIDRETFLKGLNLTAGKPFRVVPFFDPAPWGGQWMKEVCDLDREMCNYGWCFDCVPEENSLYLEVNGLRFELPAQDLILLRSREVLGEIVEARFGKDFPIRFDFLDTIGGGNLSLQVHPTTQFIHENMGMHYTQDESYYLLDAKEDAVVYLGVKNGVEKKAMLEDLRAAQRGEIVFDAEKYINKIHAKKHDHYLIPAGTIHCSGAGSMVLEISATPNLFTFKLWDWQRLGLDGKPRPINVERGSKVIQWNRDTDYVHNHLVNVFEPVAKGEGWDEIKTGLHPNEFIETRRTRFTVPVEFNTEGGVQVLNLVEGDEAIVESINGSFEPLIVHYAETFIIPGCIGSYTIRPYGASEGKQCMVIRAYCRYHA